MKQLILILALTMTSATSFAHFKFGTYKGNIGTANECSFTILAKNYKNNLRHPLNEIVTISLHFLGNGRNNTYDFSHLPIVNADEGTVRPKRHILTSYSTFPGGAAAAELFMTRSGPQRLVTMVDNYENPERNRYFECTNLEFIERRRPR